jgi:hypothetical protein
MLSLPIDPHREKFRTTTQELISVNTRCDAGRYVELLEIACETVIQPFE